MTHLLQMTGISKGFPGVRALDDVSIVLDAGEVLGIVGENGAGKSTLMKVLAGVYRPDQGHVSLAGATFAPRRPRDALDRGIVVIHQELSLVPDRTVAENVFLGHLPRDRLGFVQRRRLYAATRGLLMRVGLDLSPQTRVRSLGIAKRQLVEIARALSREARVIVMDEPTATLTQTEQRILFATVATLKASGVGIIFISHHLEEIFTVCDRVTVMRDGRTVATRPAAAWDKASLIQAMVNRPITDLFPQRQAAVGDTLLELRGLGSRGRFADVSLSVRAGEVVGLGGLIGAGRTEVLKTIFGALPRSAGTVRVGDRTVNARGPRDAIAAGIALVPEDRKGEGLILAFSLRVNVALATFARRAWMGLFVAGSRVDALAREAVESLRIRTPGIRATMRNLSGGNQQKVVLARALTTEPKVFLLDEPTRGIDVGAKVEVYRLIGELAERGGAVLVVSSDMLELLGLCDRILVMRAGRLVGELGRDEFSQELVMQLAALG